jgi:hypothetical protein
MSEQNLPTSAVDFAPPGVVRGQPRVWLGVEGAAVLFIVTAIYRIGGYSWLLYAVLFLLPDISILGYLLGPRVGAACYNLLHNYALPIVLIALCRIMNLSPAIPLIWAAHVAFDRVFGYGLKYDQGFNFTHLSGPRKSD